jgi:acetyltransferase-like isoleucine patch superfamily enzyme
MGDDLVILGQNCDVDPGALLGYRTGRPITLAPLRLGDLARIRSGSVIYTNTTIGQHFETGHNVIVREENEIGDHVSIWNNTVIDYGCKIGHGVRIHSNCYIAQFTTIEDDVFLAPGVSIANDPHPICALCMRGPTFKKGCRVGVNVTVLSHVIIGEGAVIGSGSVVTRDVPAHSLAYGNPARVRKNVDELTCQFHLTVPYVNGQDPMTRFKQDPAKEQALRDSVRNQADAAGIVRTVIGPGRAS